MAALAIGSFRLDIEAQMQNTTELSRQIGRVVWAVLFALVTSVSLSAAERAFRAGAHAIEITPTNFPVIVNAMFTERTATKAHDPLHARCLVLDDGTNRIVIAVVDTCMMPRDLIDQAKELARRQTGIPTDRMLVSATHTHSAPSAMGCLGSRADTNYARFLPGRIGEGIARAASNLAPARIGWTVVQDAEHTHNRRWIRRPDRLLTDPFGVENVRAHMHPGYESPDVIGPSGPVDPDLSIVSIQSADGRPLALLANYSMHYYDSPLLSADYFGRFASKIARLLGAEGREPAFVGIMSQGTSGDLMWMDYSKPRKDIGYDAYAEALARKTHESCAAIQYHDWVPLVMREAKLNLSFRAPNAERLAWARKLSAELNGRLPRTLPEIYALEQIHLRERPTAELKLQALRIGTLGIAAIPNEVFAITGLKIKAQSPLQPAFNVELANGAEGYIPPPEQHKLGGYTTWPARTAGLETNAEPKIIDAVLRLLEEVAGEPRRKLIDRPGRYGRMVLTSKPAAYWRMGEFEGPRARDSSPNNHDATHADGVAFFLPGPESDAFSEGAINRAAHFAGGRVTARLNQLGGIYSIECWIWNGLPSTARPVTGYICSRGLGGDKQGDGDHLGIGGASGSAGRLFFFNGNQRNQILSGTTEIKLRTWNQVVLVRNGRNVRVFLNGNAVPEIAGDIDVTVPVNAELFIGGRNDHFSNFEGKIDEVSVYDRALTAEEVSAHYRASGFSGPANVTP